MNSLIGIWMYASLIYQGQPIPPPNPDLKIYYNFETENINEIFYYRTNENGTCRRKAEYTLKNSELHQTVISIDPSNAEFCSQDTDMQLGNFSKTKYELKDNKMYLYLPLGDEYLIYVWEKVNE